MLFGFGEDEVEGSESSGGCHNRCVVERISHGGGGKGSGRFKG